MAKGKMKLSEKIKDKLSFDSESSSKKKKHSTLTIGEHGAVKTSSPSFTDKVKAFFSFGGGGDGLMIETSADERYWKDEWPKQINNYHDVYEKISIVRKCINLLADFSVSIGFDVTTDNDDVNEAIRKMWDRTNFAEVLKIAIKKREIWGGAAFYISTDGDEIVDFIPLHNERFDVKINPETMEISHYTYTTKQKGKMKLDKDEVFYVTKDALDTRKKGVSALESIKTTIRRKRNLEKDMEQAAKRLWAPYNIFEYDTSYVKNEEQQRKEIREFVSKIGPGKTIVHNQNVEPNIIDMSPDLSALNQAIRSADEEIIGNWGIPKALLSRQRTEDMSTLEFSIQTLYEGPVSSIQQYFKKEIEKQVYEKVVDMKGYNPEEVQVEHIWNANKFHDSPTIRALTYSVKEGVISPQAMIEMLGWNSKSLNADIDDKVEPRERKDPEDRPVTMSSLIEQKIKDVLEDYEGTKAVKEMEKEGIISE
ncbi:MAG: phage portal protein [Promethearchaeota archaeon]